MGKPRPQRLETRPHCSGCGRIRDAYSPIAGNRRRHPIAGDFSICRYCETIMVYVGKPLTLRRPTAKQREMVLASNEYKLAMRKLRIERAIKHVVSTKVH